MMIKNYIIAVLPLLVCVAEGANILGIFPLPSRSHMAVHNALLKELASRGHQLTVLSPLPEKTPTPNYTHIDTGGTLEEILEKEGTKNAFDIGKMSYIQITFFFWKTGELFCHKVLEHEAVQNILKSEDMHYDLIIIEGFSGDCFAGFSHKFKAPLIQIITFDGNHWMRDWVGNTSPYAYVPDPIMEFSDHMTFYERLINTLGITFQKITRELYFVPQQQAILEQYFGHLESLPTITELVSSTSLILINNHFSIGFPRPHLPNTILVGGMHIKSPKQLPQDLQKFITEAPDGVVYFSMGSGLRSVDMPENIRNSFIEAFKKLKQRVIWKWEDDILPGKPDNVKIGKWFPQSDILAHPNVRLFITHGGLLSTQETIHRAVPIIGIPIAADQKLNMARTESIGIGIKLEFENISEESLSWVLKEVLENKRYREKAENLSRIYRDQPLTPLDQAVYWTEYVIRHKGAPHMRCAALDLNWFQYHLLDVIVFLLVCSAAVVAVLFLLFKAIFRKCCANKTQDKKREKYD